MEIITKYNVEAWLLDYHEGNLTPSQEQILHEYLQANPETSIDPDFDISLTIKAPQIQFEQKSDLYRTEFSIPELSEEEIECIAALEGDLFPGELKSFQERLKHNPQKALLYKKLSQTKLKPDENLTFQNKEKLYRKVVLWPRYVYGVVATAAILILAWFVFTPLNQNIDTQDGLAQDTIKELIYLDKIAHPGRFDRIASNNLEKTPVKSSYAITEEIPIDSNSSRLVQEDYQISKIQKLDVASIRNYEPFVKTSSEAFVFRSYPFEETIEYQTFLAYSGDLIRKNILGQDPELVKKTRFSLWELADAGLEKLATIIPVPMDINREYDNEGDLVEVSFDSRLLAFTTPVNARKAQ